MFKKASLFTLGISLPLLSGLFSFNYESNKVTQVNAWYKEKPLYIDLSKNSKFLEDGASPYIHYENNDVNLELVSNDIYKTPDNIYVHGNYEICAFGGAYKTVSITEEKYNYVYVNEYIEGEDASIKGYGYYLDKTPNPGATYRTQRVWLSCDVIEEDRNNVIMYSSSDTYVQIEMTQLINSYDGKSYYYADIPFDISSISFLHVSNEENHNYLIHKEVKVNRLSYGTCYLLSEDGYANITVRNANATMLAYVSEAFLTYGKSDSNGTTLSTVKSLFSIWFNNKSASKDDLKNIKIWDYTGYAANGNSYEGLEKNQQFSVNEKWNTMCSQVGIDPNTGLERNNFLEWIKEHKLIVIAIVGLTVIIVPGIVIIIVMKKKKERS